MADTNARTQSSQPGITQQSVDYKDSSNFVAVSSMDIVSKWTLGGGGGRLIRSFLICRSAKKISTAIETKHRNSLILSFLCSQAVASPAKSIRMQNGNNLVVYRRVKMHGMMTKNLGLINLYNVSIPSLHLHLFPSHR